ncbi:DUF4389 domain-containing protein [Streptomyces aureocirculatus]|uniref:DUF4389 domain-containing protein n=1 Tax=Streptomyces aureocirculatus TaxID=67275 RepID=UPI001CEC769D
MKWLLAVPHYLVLSALGVAATAVVIMGFFAVLFTGIYPQRLRDKARRRNCPSTVGWIGLGAAQVRRDDPPPYAAA